MLTFARIEKNGLFLGTETGRIIRPDIRCIPKH
jgi:hypothetical protein